LHSLESVAQGTAIPHLSNCGYETVELLDGQPRAGVPT
jgi:hypothetical protein